MSAATVLALSVTVLLRGSAAVPADDADASATGAVVRPALASNPLLLGSPTASPVSH